MSMKKPLDPDSAAALEVVGMEKLQEESVANGQASREQMIAQTYQFIGRIQSADMFGKLATVSTLVWLKQVKASGVYKDLPNVGTWESFCNYLGKSRRLVDEQLLNLEKLGPDFLETCFQLQVGYRDLKKLRQLTNDGAVQIEDQVITIGDETIPLDADHREDLQDAIENILDFKNTQLNDTKADLRSQGRVLKAKEDVINKQEREIAKHEARAEKKGFTPGEEAFLQEMENSRVTIDGWLIKFDPSTNPLPEDATPRMEAAYMEVLGYFKRVIDAAYDTAADQYGHGEMDSGWVPPNLRVVNEGEE